MGRTSGFWNGQTKKRAESVVSFPKKTGMSWKEHGLSPDGSVMLSLSDRGCLLQTDTRSETSERFVAPKNSYGQPFSFSADGKLAATRIAGETLFIWDIVERKTVVEMEKPNYGNGDPRTFRAWTLG